MQCPGRERLTRVISGATAALLITCPHVASAATVDIGGGTRIYAPLKSIKERRDQNVVKQGFDYSCGAGALATLLTYGLGDRISEAEVLQAILTELSKDEEALRKKKGLSLLDMQKLVQQRGHKAQGFRLAPESLSRLRNPVIVFIKPRGYEHFAVFKGIRNDRVFLADPSLGNIRMPMYKFLDMWLDDKGRGIVFIAERKDGQWDQGALEIDLEGPTQPEVLSARQLLEIGNPSVRR